MLEALWEQGQKIESSPESPRWTWEKRLKHTLRKWEQWKNPVGRFGWMRQCFSSCQEWTIFRQGRCSSCLFTIMPPNQLPQNSWLKTIDIYLLTSLWVINLGWQFCLSNSGLSWACTNVWQLAASHLILNSLGWKWAILNWVSTPAS